MSDPKDKVVEEKEPDRKKPPGYRNCERILRQVINAPPLRKVKTESLESPGLSLDLGDHPKPATCDHLKTGQR